MNLGMSAIIHLTNSHFHLADTFIQSVLQMRIIEAIKPTKEQQHASAMTSLGLPNTGHVASVSF